MDGHSKDERDVLQTEEIQEENSFVTSADEMLGQEREDGGPESVSDSVEEVEQFSLSDAKNEKKFCGRCGAELLPNQVFCSQCGQKVGEAIDVKTTERKRINKKTVIIIGAVALALIIMSVVFVLVRGVQAKEITLNKDSLTIRAGEIEELTYVISPEDTKNKTATWKSSNTSIAQVNNGTITAINEGDCVITVSTKNGKTDTCSVVVTAAAPNLQAIYNEYCDSLYSSLASDYSYITIDTNPFDIDDYSAQTAIDMIFDVNEALGLPESVINKMGSTRALDGVQTYEGDSIEVSWTYHPNDGLEITYSLVN